jgi:prepilin signal peptidase PulO-like enzyme (type II secretory pathway)
VLPLPLWYKVVVVGVYGLIVGSYLPVVIYRVPRGMSTHLPRSSCPDCGHMIALYDIIPVFSWLWLRGRCRAGFPFATHSWRRFVACCMSPWRCALDFAGTCCPT